MYSRDFGGIKSEGQLYNYEREYNESRERDFARDDREKNHQEREKSELCSSERTKGTGLDFLRDLRLDDLILIGVGILLLLDSNGENDLFVIILALLLLF
ncbi:MAG: hypothetical protein IKT34_01020 [Clostridia bacterium]|nr:hypothetical protein [Clostridia bacterium]